MKKHFTLMIFIAALVMVTTAGCYTLLHHPGDEESYSVTRGSNDCISCHPDYHEDYGFSHYYYPDYWSSYDRWGQFYAVPWWWDYYWYDDEYYRYGSGSDGTSPRSPNAEPAVRPGSRFEDNTLTNVPTVTRGNTWTTGSSSSGGVTKTKDDSADGGGKVETKTKETRNTETKKESKSTRRSGRWKGK